MGSFLTFFKNCSLVIGLKKFVILFLLSCATSLTFCWATCCTTSCTTCGTTCCCCCCGLLFNFVLCLLFLRLADSIFLYSASPNYSLRRALYSRFFNAATLIFLLFPDIIYIYIENIF